MGKSWLRFKVAPRVFLIGLACASFLVGLGLAKLGIVLNGWWWPLVLVCLLALCWRRRVLWAVPAVVAMGVGFGAWRGGDMIRDLAAYSSLVGQKVVVTGRVVDDATFNTKKQIDFMIGDVHVKGHSLPGQMRITSFSILEPKRGDLVSASGKLYDGFGNYQAAVFYAQLTPLATNDNLADSLRHQFAAGIQSNIPEPEASLGLGFLLGVKSQLPSDMTAQLKVLNLTHIVVASGYNLTILVRLARRFFERQSKFVTLATGLALMGGFVAVTGFSASMSRAALVTGLALWAWYFGRRVHPIVLLLVAASITAFANPLYVWGDLGWWLSFLSFAGVLLVAPLLQRRIFGKRRVKIFGQVVIETLSAQLLSLPLMLLVFGNFSLLGLPANVLVVPLIPLAMLLTFLSGVAAIFLPSAAGLLAWPASIVLSFITNTIALLSHFNWASVPLSVAAPTMIGLYVLLVLGTTLLRRATKFRYLSASLVE